MILRFFNYVANCITNFFGFKRVYYSVPTQNIKKDYIVIITGVVFSPEDILIMIADDIKRKKGVVVKWDEIQLI